jgi:hypothetical protein
MKQKEERIGNQSDPVEIGSALREPALHPERRIQHSWKNAGSKEITDRESRMLSYESRSAREM